jgi:4-hydroxyphenylacetate 3-monooxygenase
MTSITATVQEPSGKRSQTFDIVRMYNLGSATRNAEAARPHQEEVKKAGINIAFHVPAPRIYPIAPFALTLDPEILVQGSRTSGEVEIALVVTDRLYVGVGSDHSDRGLETYSIPYSKQVCQNVLAPTLWPFDQVAAHWDQCRLQSRVDGRLYQDVGVDVFLHPLEMLKVLKERVPGLPERDFAVFGGTVASVNKELGYGSRWEVSLADPVLGRTLSHAYRVTVILDEVAERYRVPLATPEG